MGFDFQERTSEDSKESESFQQLLTARIQEFVEEVHGCLVLNQRYIALSSRCIFVCAQAFIMNTVEPPWATT